MTKFVQKQLNLTKINVVGLINNLYPNKAGPNLNPFIT